MPQTLTTRLNLVPKLPVLILTNRIEYSLDRQFQVLDDWLKKFTPFELDLTTKKVSLQLSFEQFLPEIYGLVSIKEQIRKLGIVESNKYRIVIFLYQRPQNQLKINAWTYPNPLYTEAFIESPCDSSWIDDIPRILSHELCHAFHRLCWFDRITTLDDMDLYDKEYEMYAVDGNRYRNIQRIIPYWPYILKPKSFWDTLLSVLKSLSQLISKQMLSKIDIWALAIKDYEGYYTGSRSFRNKNPGNMKFSDYTKSLGATDKDDSNFCIFPNYEIGLNALKQLLKDSSNGELISYHSKGIKPSDFTLQQFFNVYAPSGDNNEPNAYCLFVARRLGVNPTVKISNLLN